MIGIEWIWPFFFWSVHSSYILIPTKKCCVVLQKPVSVDILSSFEPSPCIDTIDYLFSLFINLYFILVHCFIVFVVTWVFILLNMINNDLNVVIKTLYYHYILPFDVILNLTWQLDFQLINDILLRNCMPVIVWGTKYFIQVGDCFILAFHGKEDKTLYQK